MAILDHCAIPAICIALHSSDLPAVLGVRNPTPSVSDAIVYLYIIDCFQILIPYFGWAGGMEMVGKRRTRRKKGDHNEIHSLKRKCPCSLSRHVKQQRLLVKIGL